MIIFAFYYVASSVTDAVIFVSIDLNVTTISSNLTHSTIIVHIIRVNVSVNLLADSTNDSMIVIVERSTVTANDLVNVVTVALDDTYTTIIMLRDVTSSTYNITVISIIHPESEADMVNVTANDETGNVCVLTNLLYAIYVRTYVHTYGRLQKGNVL